VLAVENDGQTASEGVQNNQQQQQQEGVRHAQQNAQHKQKQ